MGRAHRVGVVARAQRARQHSPIACAPQTPGTLAQSANRVEAVRALLVPLLVHRVCALQTSITMAAHVPRVSVRQAYQARLVFLIAHALQDTGGRGESALHVVEENSVHFLAKPLKPKRARAGRRAQQGSMISALVQARRQPLGHASTAPPGVQPPSQALRIASGRLHRGGYGRRKLG